MPEVRVLARKNSQVGVRFCWEMGTGTIIKNVAGYLPREIVPATISAHSPVPSERGVTRRGFVRQDSVRFQPNYPDGYIDGHYARTAQGTIVMASPFDALRPTASCGHAAPQYQTHCAK